MSDLLTRYRVMAYIVGVVLVVLVLVGMPMKYLAGDPWVVEHVGPLHGWLYAVYLVVTVHLSRRRGWALAKTAGVLLAGTVPFLSFVVERRVTATERRAGALAQPAAV